MGGAKTVEQFVQSLTDIRLVSEADIADCRRRLPEHRPADNAQALARELVRGGRLTRYQAALAYHGKARLLVLGNYVILEKIASGGMGHVFKARHRRMKRTVALKVVPASVADSGIALLRFEREVEAAARLVHPHIVTAFDADEARGVHFLVMEYVEGTDLGHLVKQHGPLHPSTALDYVLQAAAGLEYAHRQGVVHRDVKPSNLMLSSTGVVKVLDLGLARLHEASRKANTQSGSHAISTANVVVGTPDYMAPEQALSPQHIDHRVDIYGLGCTLFFLVTGRPPYAGDTTGQRLNWHQQRVPLLQDTGIDVPEAFDLALRRMMAKDAEHRQGSMDEVIVDLQHARAALTGADARALPRVSVAPPGKAKPCEPDASTHEDDLTGTEDLRDGRLRVLLVDDHALVRAGVRSLSNCVGVCIVAEAVSGEAALEEVRSHRPQVVVMDVELPGMSGLEAARQIIQGFPETRVLMLSLHANEEYVLQALTHGATGYVLKDAAAPELELALRAVARGETYLSPAVSKHVVAGYMKRVGSTARA